MPKRKALTSQIGRKMVRNCRGNPAWLPILRAATSGGRYIILFGSGYAGLGKEGIFPSTKVGLRRKGFKCFFS